MSERTDAGTTTPGTTPHATPPQLEARDLHLSFGQTPALRGASVSVAAGELLAVMGPERLKSTLLHCLAGILVPDAGRVLVAGSRLDTLREAERSELRRRRFGFVFQFGQLVPELTAEENVALPLLLNGVGRAEAPGWARSWFDRLDLGGMAGRRSGELSGGKAQRVASAGLFLRAQTGYSLQAPGLGYWVLVGGGIVASLAIIASMLPLLGRTTGPDAVRSE